MAKDKSHVWYRNGVIEGIDPQSLVVVREDHAWKDDHNVWYKQHILEIADSRTYCYLANNYYKDARNVFWCSSPLKGADPLTFRVFQADLPYGRDRNAVWFQNKLMENVDVNSFNAVHRDIYTDRTGVYVNSVRLEDADPKSFHKLSDLSGANVLLSDGNKYYVYLGLPFGIHEISLQPQGELNVCSRIVDNSTTPNQVVGKVEITWSPRGWHDLKIDAPENFQNRSPKMYQLLEHIFKEAHAILSKQIEKPVPKKREPIKPCPWPNGVAPTPQQKTT